MLSGLGALRVLLILTIFTILYRDTFFRLFKGWFSYEESHGLLILGISIYFIWKKRNLLKAINPNPLLFYGAILLILGCFILVAGKLSQTHIIQDVSIIFSLFGIVLLIGGVSAFKILFLPIGYLVFMFPVFSELLSNFSIYLQQTTAIIAANLLKIFGMPVLRTAQFIELPHISLEVAQACNGINHIMALVALSIPLAILAQNSLSKKASLVIIAFIIGIMANGLRVALIGIWSAYKKNGPLHGPHDIFYVSFIFFFGMGLLLIINRWLQIRSSSPSQSISPSRDFSPKSLHSPFGRGRSNDFPKYLFSPLGEGKGEGNVEGKKKVIFAPILIGTLIFIPTIIFLHFYRPIPILLGKHLTSFPVAIGEWQGKDMSQIKDFLSRIRADEELNRVYKKNSGEELELFIRYFSLQEKGRSITDYRFYFPDHHRETFRIRNENSIININKIKKFNHNKEENIYFWYEIGGKTINHHYLVKFELFKNSLLFRNSNGAIIFIISKVRPDKFEESNYLQTLIKIIKAHLS
ncbi:MAG: exosortase W [Candidatus Omnitrophica bacterium]|nr:exosortase W [Candidatus Omnitrophota bacterium]